jgi:ATP-binding cassette subfamily F protein 3
MDSGRTAYDELLADAPYDMVPRLRDILGAFLFSGDDIHKAVSVLSGGEKNRLALAKMLLRPSNLLLMDEPTNHLDLSSKDVLLDALRDFPGTVVFVSHDRHFINGLATRVVEVEDGKLVSYFGDYEYFLEKKEWGSVSERRLPEDDRSANGPASSPAPLPPLPPSKAARQRRREDEKERQRAERRREKRLEEIEAEIGELEDTLDRLEGEMSDPSFFADHERARKGGEEHDRLSRRVTELYGEWEGLQ